MTTPAKINFKVYQGSTFSEVLRWESPVIVYKPITAITQAAPVVITATAHGAPVNWRVKLTNILGMTDLNSNDTYQVVTDTSSNTITINAINSLNYKAYISGGIVQYNQPVNLTGFTARMQIRSDIDSQTVLAELTTANGGIVLDNTAKTITLTIPATVTAAFTFTTAVYDLELISSGLQVTQFCGGILTLYKEVTR
jgi:repressor of nif and glnA expression